MSTHPYIPLYVDDFEAATAHLTPEEDGIYNRLMRLCWRTPGCSLPNDPAWIARKIRVSSGDFDRLVRPILAEFFSLHRGRFVQRRLKAEYDDISRKKSARADAGKKGGDAKARKTKGKDSGNATVLPSDTRALPNPEPEPEREVIDTSLSQAGESAASPVLSGELIAEARARIAEAGVDLDAAEHAKRFTAHAESTGRKLASVEAAWREWVRREIDKAPKAKAAPPSPAPRPTWNGPSDLRDAIAKAAEDGEPWTRAWIDAWTYVQQVPNTKVLIAKTRLAFDRIHRDFGVMRALRDHGYELRLQEAAA